MVRFQDAIAGRVGFSPFEVSKKTKQNRPKAALKAQAAKDSHPAPLDSSEALQIKEVQEGQMLKQAKMGSAEPKRKNTTP